MGALETRLSYQEAREKRELEDARAEREHVEKLERNRTRQGWLAAVLSIVLLVAIFSVGIYSERDMVSVPQSSAEFEGRDYQAVVADLRAAGLTSVEASAVPDLKVGLWKKPGEVKEVSINGTTDFSAEDSFPSDASVVVRYHTFPEKE